MGALCNNDLFRCFLDGCLLFFLQAVDLFLQAGDLFSLVLDCRQERVQLFILDRLGELRVDALDKVGEDVHVVVEGIVGIVARGGGTRCEDIVKGFLLLAGGLGSGGTFDDTARTGAGRLPPILGKDRKRQR